MIEACSAPTFPGLSPAGAHVRSTDRGAEMPSPAAPLPTGWAITGEAGALAGVSLSYRPGLGHQGQHIVGSDDFVLLVV